MPPARKNLSKEKPVTNDEQTTKQKAAEDDKATDASPTQYGITNVEKLTDSKPPTPTPPTKEDIEKVDIEAALARKTQDGPGEEKPASDDASPSPSGDSDSEHIQQVASEVLRGDWGTDERTVRRNLAEHDYVPGIVFIEVNRRLSAGAPSVLPVPDVKRVASQVIAGEWGSDKRVIKQRLEGANHLFRDVEAEMKRQLGKE